MTDVIIFQVDTYPVYCTLELVLFTFGIVVGNRQSKIAADLQSLIGRENEGYGLADTPLTNLHFIEV